MYDFSKTRRTMLGFVLTAASAGSLAQAQSAADRALPVPPPPGQGDLVINCCRCLGQEAGALNISTGTAPWRVSSVISPPWGLNAMTGPTNTSPQMLPGNIGTNPLNGVWTNALAPAAWLQPSTATTMGSFANGHVTYKLKVRVPNCTIKQKVILAGQVAADDKAVMFVDGTGGGPVALSPTTPHPFAGFSALGIKTFSHQLGSGPYTQPGTYVIRVEVDNLGGGPFGMVLNGTAKGKCDDRLEKGKDDRADGECQDC